jgi:hypothetical protein
MWLVKVHRKTKSGRIIIQSKNMHGTFETVYNSDGSERGGQEYYRENLVEPTTEIREQIEFKFQCSRFRGVDPSKLTLSQLRRIDAIIREPHA